MIHKIHKSQEKARKKSIFSPFSITIILILAVLLIVSGYFNYWLYFQNLDLKTANLGIQQFNELAKKYISGQVTKVSADKLTIKSETLGEKEIGITAETRIIKIMMTTKPVPASEFQSEQEINLSEIKQGDTATIKLTGTIDDQRLIAENIEVF